MKRSFFSVTLLLILFAAYPYYAATKNPGCNSISTTIVKNDTFTTKINCGNWGGWEVIRTKNGILDGAREFYNLDGKLLVRDSNNNGKLEGHREEWSSDGWLEKYQSYHSGHLSDTLLVFFDHGGNLRLFSVFDTAGKKKGWSMTWADNGILLDSAYYVRNEMKEAYYFWRRAS